MNWTVDGRVQQDVHTEQDVDAATFDPTARHQHAADAGSRAQEPPPPEVASHQIVVGDIPLEPPGFQPRADLLAELDRSNPPVVVIHAVTGLQGLGTTQLAAAYARAKLAAGWRMVAWVNGADTGSLQAGLAAVADAAGLADGDSGREVADAGQAVRYLLEADGDRCLLVFDDVPDPEVLRPLIPAEGGSRVLITSTRQPATNLGTGVAMDVFSADQAAAFLVARTGLDDEAGAAALAAVLGHLPLALALAAPLIGGRYPRFGWYLDQLQAMPAEMPDTEDDSQPYPPGVAQAVRLSLQAVRAADQTGVCTRVLEIVAMLSAAGVRRELLHFAGQAGMLASGWRRAPTALVDRVLEWLGDRSLLTFSVDGQVVMMHRLVAEVIRDGLARRQRWAAVYRASAFVLEAYAVALAKSQDRLTERDIPRQVTALLDNAAGLAEEDDDELVDCLLRLQFIALYHLLELGDGTQQAIAIGEPLARDLERLLGPDHPDTLNSRNSLAAAYLAAGRAGDAIPLFEQTLAGRRRVLGPDDPETLTSQNNLAAAYQDVGRAGDAIPLLEQTLAVRERLLGVDHPSTLTSRGNLAAAYRDAGQAAEAIPLFEQTLAGRERALGSGHPDTRTSRKNLARAYRDAGRVAEAIPLFEQTLAGPERALGSGHPDTRTSRKNPATTFQNRSEAAQAILPAEQPTIIRERKPPADSAGQALPVAFRWPPADPASRALPVEFRRPPADPARRPLPGGVVRPPAKLNNRSSASRTQDPLGKYAQYDREVVAAITAGDAAGIAAAYDGYAAALYGYCHWMLHGSEETAGAFQDTFVIAVATLGDLPEPAKLRPWLFGLARNECRRRIRATSVTRDEEVDAANARADVVGQPPGAADWLMDATMPMPVVSQSSDAAPTRTDETMPMRVVSQWPHAAPKGIDVTTPMRVVHQWPDAAHAAVDVTMPFREVSRPIDATDGLSQISGDPGQAELRTLIYPILAELRPREREVIELSFRHDLYDEDLAIALGVSRNRARALGSRARGRLEKALDALLVALTRRDACPALGELLADWNGRLTKRTRNLIDWHLVQCHTCASHGQGQLRPAAFSRLLPLAPLPPELRARVLNRCASPAEDAVTYRQQVVLHADSTWYARFSEAIGWRWDSIRGNPGAAIGTLAVALWAMAAVSITLLIIAGANITRAPAAQPSVRTASSSPAAAAVATAPAVAPTSASARPSRTTRPSPTYVPTYMPSASPAVQTQPSASRSPTPSKSPKPSKSPTPSPSHSGSSSPSPSGSSSSPSPTP